MVLPPLQSAAPQDSPAPHLMYSDQIQSRLPTRLGSPSRQQPLAAQQLTQRVHSSDSSRAFIRSHPRLSAMARKRAGLRSMVERQQPGMHTSRETWGLG